MGNATAARQRTTTTTKETSVLEKMLRDAEMYARDASPEELRKLDRIGRALRLAEAMGNIREALSNEVMEAYVMPLMNSHIGFQTDRPIYSSDPQKRKPAYTVDELRDPVIVALLAGAELIGNEFNVISKRCYLTREYYVRALGELPGISNIVPAPGIPDMPNGRGYAKIRYGLSWVYRGEVMRLEDGKGEPGATFSINVNAGMGPDAVIGKATRKAYKRAYDLLTGSTIGGVVDDDVVDNDEPDEKRTTSADALKPKQATEHISEQRGIELEEMAENAGLSGLALTSHLQTTYGVESVHQLNNEQAESFQEYCNSRDES